MKKKLNLLCILIFAVLACNVALTLNVMFTGAISGYNTAVEMKDATRGKGYDYRTVAILPTEVTDRNSTTITDGVTGKAYKAWPTQLMLPAEDCRGGLPKPVTVGLGLLALAAGVAMFAAFFLFVRNINRREIFTRKNTTYLRRIGWCMMALGVILSVNFCSETYAVQQSFGLTGYVIDYSSCIYFDFLLFGLFSLVIAEAFNIGLKMKEEQELTI